MQCIESVTGKYGSLSFVQLEPKTGRSHQLRVQSAHRGLPIVGDATYGDFRRNRSFAKQGGDSRLFLHSYRTAFTYEWEGKNHQFVAEAPLPGEFNTALTS
jgi:23S rRNA-/tRNA-specific pseudouridylate synthase